MELLDFTLYTLLSTSFVLFLAGLYVLVSKKNMIHMLIGVELMLNAAVLNFIGFGKLLGREASSTMIALFAIIIAVGAAAVALAIILNYYKNKHSIHPGKNSLFEKE